MAFIAANSHNNTQTTRAQKKNNEKYLVPKSNIINEQWNLKDKQIAITLIIHKKMCSLEMDFYVI